MNTRFSLYQIIALLACFVYLAGFGFEYLLDPLGRSPVLDAAENVAWAERIAVQDLPAEPFYRALLYPWVLSLLGLQGAALAQVASLFGVLCHLFNALLVGLLAKRLWGSVAAGWFASSIYTVYPVAMYFSVQVLDITLGTGFFLLAIYLVLRACDSSRMVTRLSLLIAAGLVGGACVLTRPNFLLPLLILPLLPAMLSIGAGRMRLRVVAEGGVLFLALGLPLLGQGLLNQRLSGDFRVLPWQGAYNLYAANHSTANGKFFMQSVSFDEIPVGMNPTRMESEYLYRQGEKRLEEGDLKGEDAPLEIDAMNAYWRSQLWAEVSANPWRWLSLMGRKSIYVLNDWEQYNNLTYAFHKARFSSLRWNPLGWGVLLLGGVGCGILGYPRAQRAVFISLGLLGLAYAAGLLLFFASARFRLPLVPLLTVLCGGAVVLPWREWWRTRQRSLIQVGVGCLLGALCVYGNIYDARDEASFIQDELLLADACAKLGEDSEALRYAEAVLVRDVSRQEARRIQVVSLYNLWVFEDGAAWGSNFCLELQQALLLLGRRDAPTAFISGVVIWNRGDRAAALRTWREGLDLYGDDALGCMQALQALGEGSYVAADDAHVQLLKEILK